MAIHLTPEQERRIQAVIGCGACGSLDEAVEAAVFALEQQTAPRLEGSEEGWETLLMRGLASEEMSEAEFWALVNRRTKVLTAERKPPQ
jgi:Arc/MetJ-type ribon-helix-helix transcriptional regulator